MRISRIEWKNAVALSLVSGLISFMVFLLTQIIWGDILKDALQEGFSDQVYTIVNIILLIGLTLIFAISFVVNIFIFREYSKFSKFNANLFSFIISLIFLFFIAWIYVVIELSDFYLSLSFPEKILAFPFYFAYYSVYVLPSPVLLWYLGLIIYHIVLIFMTRIFFVKKRNIISSKSNKKSKIKERELLYKRRII